MDFVDAWFDSKDSNQYELAKMNFVDFVIFLFKII